MTQATSRTDAAPISRTSTGLAPGTGVMTMDGMIPVEHLAPGDRIITRKGARPLRALVATVTDNVRPCTIHASVLGHGHPEADVTVAPGQKLFLRGWKAQMLHGRDMAIVPATRLVDGEHITRDTPCRMRSFTLAFDTPQVIYADGIQVAMEETADALA